MSDGGDEANDPDAGEATGPDAGERSDPGPGEGGPDPDAGEASDPDASQGPGPDADGDAEGGEDGDVPPSRWIDDGDAGGGDRILDAVGVALVLFIVLGGALIVVTGINADGGNAPSANWTLTRVNDTHVRIAHLGGDTVPASDLKVTVNEAPRSATWRGDVEPGDSGVVRAPPNATVRLFWTGRSGGRKRLAAWPVAGAGPTPRPALSGPAPPWWAAGVTRP